VKTLAKLTVRLMVLLFLGLVCAVLYLDLKGFPLALKELVERQFLRAGYAVQFGAIRLDVLRGVIARDARVADAKARNRLLARIDEVELEWNWRRMVHRDMPIDALRIANATISVPTPTDEIGPQYFTAQEAYATFRFMDDGTTAIDQLSGVYCGIRVQVSGRIKPRTASAGEGTRGAPGEKSQFVFVTKALRELNSLKVSQPPQLDVSFDIDLAQPLESQVRARLVALDFGYRNLQLQKASVDVAMRAGAIDIAECRVQVGTGELLVRGRYDIAMGRFDLNLSSSLDPTLVAAALPEELARGVREVRVTENPKIEARYVLSPETGSLPLLKGTVSTGGMEFRGVPFRAISFAFENQGLEVKIANAKILTAEGQLTGRGQIHIESSDFSYEIDSTIDPRKLLPVMTPVMRQIVEPSWFETPPHIVAAVSGDFVDPDAFTYDAELTTERCSYRGVALTSVAATLHLRHSRLNVPQMTLVRDEGTLRGSLLADFNNHQISFDLQTTANPSEMAPLLGPKAAEVMRAYRFGPRTSATARGLVDLDVPGNSAWTAQVANDGFSYWKVAADRARANLSMTNNVLTIDNFDGDFYDGKLRGHAWFSLTNAADYAFDFATEHCDAHKLLAAIRGKESQASGLVTGHCTLQGQGSDLGTLHGTGNLSITDGVLGELGLFGIFSSILNEIGPGLGSTKLTSATATFKIEDKSAKSDDLRIAAGAYTLTSQGKIGFDGKLDFRVQGQLLRAVPGINIITWFLSHVFEYKIGGTLSSPNYRASNLPKELLPHGEMGPKETDKPPEN
jgi:hypothetical protein